MSLILLINLCYRSISNELNLPITEWTNQPGIGHYDIPVELGDFESMRDEESAQFAHFIHHSTLYSNGIVLVKGSSKNNYYPV